MLEADCYALRHKAGVAIGRQIDFVYQGCAMIKPWVFEFLPELGSPSVEPDPRDVATLFTRYLVVEDREPWGTMASNAIRFCTATASGERSQAEHAGLATLPLQT